MDEHNQTTPEDVIHEAARRLHKHWDALEKNELDGWATVIFCIQEMQTDAQGLIDCALDKEELGARVAINAAIDNAITIIKNEAAKRQHPQSNQGTDKG